MILAAVTLGRQTRPTRERFGLMARRVLVLDDDPSFRRELELELRRLGHEPTSFAH